MSPKSQYGRKLSQITLSLLNSTGWYIISSDLIQNLNWGLKKGCNFLSNTCEEDQNFYEEFCDDSESIYGCRYDLLARGKCSNDEYSGKCKWVSEWSNRICTNPEHTPSYANQTLEIYGPPNSACIKSSISKHGFFFNFITRCYSIKCHENNFIEIFVNDKSFACTKQQEGNFF